MVRELSYYESAISESSFIEALSVYHEYMKSEKLEPELTQDDFDAVGFAEIDEGILCHVVYHADIHGFDTDKLLIAF